MSQGRTFLEEENEPGHAPMVILTDTFWRSRLGSDPGAVGRTLRLDGQPAVVIGVLPPEFHFDYPTLGAQEPVDLYAQYPIEASLPFERAATERSYGRLSAIMSNDASNRTELLQGTLDMLILPTLIFGSTHGHQIAKPIQRTTEDVLQVEHGSLYPALHRLERKGWIISKWETAKGRNREFKYYRLTPAGRKQLAFEESKWKRLAGAIARVMWPAEEKQ